jgi:hypothetical protein
MKDGMKEIVDASIARLREYPDKIRDLLADLRAENDKRRKIEPWKEDQLNRFGEILAQNAIELDLAFADGNASKTAWVARNLLELSVWVRYCNISDEHGKRFRVDAARDLTGFFEAFTKLHYDKIKNDLHRMEKAAQEMEAVLQNEFGVPLGTAYQRVRKAAAEVGERKFESLNTLCSKLAHPTAWVVASMHFEEFDNFGAMFLIEGTMLAHEALEAIREFVLKHCPNAAGVHRLSNGSGMLAK